MYRVELFLIPSPRYIDRVNSAKVRGNAWFGEGKGTSYMVSPSCTGREADIAFCKTGYIWGRQTCSHRDDVGISCTRTALGNLIINFIFVSYMYLIRLGDKHRKVIKIFY